MACDYWTYQTWLLTIHTKLNKMTNKTKLADFNYLKHIKIIGAVIKTSKQLRT